MYKMIINEMIEYFKDDIKRINHALKVLGYSEAIMAGENLDEYDKNILKIAAILHDIGIKEAEKKYNSSIGKYQEIEGPKVAKNLLGNYNLDKDKLDRILFLIGNHHSYNKIDNIDFQILVEADFIVNIEEDNLNIDSILSIYNKYFKTKTGKNILSGLWKINDKGRIIK
jgi:CRISPR/Cas system-associated endonuclease Cas3-HD